MHIRCAAVPLLLLAAAAGCAGHEPDSSASNSQILAMQTGAPPPATIPIEPPTPSAPPAEPQTDTNVATPVAHIPEAAAPLDFKALEDRLEDTDAIGFLTKLTLRNNVDDLLDRFREYHQGDVSHTMTDLRLSYDLLIMKILSLLQDEDPKLASDIASSREAIWAMLVDPEKFATLED